ncbi:MAG: DUF1206 domain-containing protein [Acidobacteria bacterium]|nr:DUF1206 domain-containing protein [Acidobacteriota bacterium]
MSRTSWPGPPGWWDRAARLGWSTKGVLYVLLGAFALRAALGYARAKGSTGAIHEIGRQPFGRTLLFVIAAGLAAYALWRLADAFRARRASAAKRVRAWAADIGSGAIHAGLTVTAIKTALGAPSGSDHSEQALTGQLLAQPLGQFLVGACGLIVLGVAVSQFWRAASASFMRQYDTAAMRIEERTWARRIGRLGLTARGVVFALIGAFLLMAAWTANPREAAGFASSLDSIANNPSGPWLLALVALGLVAYGLHCFWEARYRRFV